MDKDTLQEARDRFQDAQDTWSDQRNDALDDIKFSRLAEQWPDSIKQQRARESRPCLTINRLPSFIRQVVNDARLNKPSIKVHPADSKADPDTAEVINGIIRNIEYTSNAEVAYDTALEDAVTCGFGYFRIGVDYAYDDAFELDINIDRIANPLSVYGDPASMACDASDWSYAFVTENLTRDQFKQKYPGADMSDWEGDYDENWLNEDNVRVAEYWTRDEVSTNLLRFNDGLILHEDQYLKNKELFDSTGLQIVQSRPTVTHRVMQRIISGAEILEETEWAGRYIPIIPVYGDEVVVEGKRYFMSLTRQAKDAQRMYNYWRTASTELVALAPKAPFIGPTGAFDTDAGKWATANTSSHPFLEYDGQIPPQRQPFAGPPAGAIQEALSASDDLKNIMGLHDASLGARSNETSGRAILARQREGDVSTYHYIDNLSRGIRYAGRVLIDLIPHVYSEPRIMRIMGYDESVENVQVNQEFEQGDSVKIHDLTAGKYDLTVSTGPSFTTQREEALTQMTQIVQAAPDLMPVLGDLIAKNMDWPGADDMAKRLKVLLPPQIQALEKMDGLPPEAQAAVAQAQGQMQQMAQMIEEGKRVLAEQQQRIVELELDKRNKEGELAQKEQDSQRKYSSDMAKNETAILIAQMKEEGEKNAQLLEHMLDGMKQRVEAIQVAQNTPQMINEEFLASMANNKEAMGQMVAIMADMAKPESKEISITAPSGAVYTGVVKEQ
jgi:hypothetical protein